MYKLARRHLLVLIPALMVLPLTYLGMRHVRTPETYPGDAIETRDCRQCEGTGKCEDLAEAYPELGSRCPFCRGDGKVDVIVPGPNRPTRIRGAVLDAGMANPLETYRSVRPGPSPLTPGAPGYDKPAGAIPGAKVVFRFQGGELIDTESNPYGLFSLRLPPGDYRVIVTAPGFETLEEELEVPVLTEPIWLEEATILDEPGSEAEAQSLHGIELLAGLAKAGSDDETFLNVSPGTPGP